MPSETMGIGKYKEILEKFNVVERCGKCGTCGTIYQNWRSICPAVEEYEFESYFLGGKNLLTWGLLHDLIRWITRFGMFSTRVLYVDIVPINVKWLKPMVVDP